MLSNLKITLDWLVVRAWALQKRAEALTTNLELFTPTYLILFVVSYIFYYFYEQAFRLVPQGNLIVGWAEEPAHKSDNLT